MRDETSWCCYHHRRAFLQGCHLIIIPVAIISAIDSHTADAIKIIPEALHGLINLLCQFPCRSHDKAVDSIFRISAIVETRENRKKICSRLASTCLGNTHDVHALDDRVYAGCLYRGTCIETHVIQGIEDIVVKQGFLKIFLLYIFHIFYAITIFVSQLTKYAP